MGFLRGGQYAVCLALIVEGNVEVGVLGCPNLSTRFNDPESTRGVLLYGVRGGKAYQKTLDSQSMENSKICEMHKVDDLGKAKFCESVESSHSSHEEQSQIAKQLGIQTASVRMDSQAKYASLTRGDAEIYLRLPINMKYEEKIWVIICLCPTNTQDHAAGQLLVELAGGKVTDMYGNPLDFGQGRSLKTKGIIASECSIHGRIIEAVRRVVSAPRTESL